MKSFFKKLAFVMALAMVVSLAAPAAAQAAEALYLAEKVDGVNVVVTEKTLALGETVDFNFVGAKSGWQKLIVGWKSSNEAVATVDQNGNVTPVAAGTTEITYELTGYEVAKATVTVKADEVDEPVVEPEFDYTQTDLKNVDLDFGQDVSKVAKEDVELYRVFTYNDKEVEVFWPIDGYKADANIMTIAPFVKFGDGDHYRVKFGTTVEDFYTRVPELEEITHVETYFGTNEAANNSQAGVSNDETGVEVVVNLSYKLFSMDMDVTELFADEVDVEFVLKTPDPDGDSEELDSIEFNGDVESGSIMFYDDITAVVETLAIWENEEGEDETIPCSQPAIITPTDLPEYGYDSIVGWTLWDGTSKANTVTWYDETTELSAIKEVPADAKGYRVVLKIKDSYDKEYVTDKGLATDKVPFIGDSLLADEVWFEYHSTNTDTFLVNVSGDEDDRYATPALTTYTKATGAVVYIDLHQTPADDAETDETFVDTVYAFRFNIGAPKKFTSLVASGTMNVNADALEESFVKTTITIDPKCQREYDSAHIDVANPSYTITCNVEDAEWETKNVDTTTGVLKLTFNGADLYRATKKTSFKWTVKEENSGLSTTFTITLDEPNWRDRGTEDKKPNGERGIISVDLNTPIKDVEGHYDMDLLIDLDGYKNKKLSLKLTKGVDLATSSGDDKKQNTEFEVVANVKVNKTSGGLAVGSHKVDNTDESNWIILDNKKWAETTGTYHVGDRLVALLDGNGKMILPDGELYKVTVDADGTGFDVRFTETTNDVVKYAKKGTYTLAIYTVTSEKADGTFKTASVMTQDINLKDNRKLVTFNEREAISTPADSATTLEDVKAIVLDCFSFNLGNKVWGLDAEKQGATVISDVQWVENGDYVIIKNVTFKVPVDGSTSLGYKTDKNGALEELAGEDYYTLPAVDVNMSVKLGVDVEE